MILWEPQPKQQLALSCPAFELFYGGAAGGGKSDFLLADFLAGCNEGRGAWRGILFRRTYKELEELVDKSRKIISKEEFCKKVEEFYPEHKAKEGA